MSVDSEILSRTSGDSGLVRQIKNTQSLCPECLAPIDADVVERDGAVWMEKTCPDHGEFSALLASDIRHYYENSVDLGNVGSCCGGSCDSIATTAAQEAGTAWNNHSCTVLIEITERCNLSCPTCFAGSSPQHSKMMSLVTFRQRLDGLLAGGKQGADMIQLSGGEPTVHPEFFAMVEMLFDTGFNKVTINSNGIKLAQPAFVERLAEIKAAYPAGELFVYLQFDGFDDATHLKLRGRADLLKGKRRALQNCLDADIRVHPVMTLTRDINDHEVGNFLSLAVDNPSVKHAVIQPAMYSGRYDNPRHAHRLTVADTVQLIADQFGTFGDQDFGPIPCSDPNCHSSAVAIRTDEGLIPVSRYFPKYADWDTDEARDLIAAFTNTINGPDGFAAAIRWATSDQRMVPVFESLSDAEVDRLLNAIASLQTQEGALWDRLLTISIKPFMDAWTYDQHRVDKCCVHILDDDGNPVSFCQYNAVNRPAAILA